MRVSRRVYVGAALAAAIVLALGVRDAGAYTTYTASEDSGNCFTCHGDFNSGSYADWGTDLMDGHESVISDCDVCHTSLGNFYPTSTFSSGNATFNQSCLGCHGRFEPGLASTDASGLRQHHWREGVEICGSCHPLDSDPSGYTPVGEDVLPPNYDVNLSVISLTDPCNPGGAGEDFAGASAGLDNDGDLMYDGLDPDCAAPTTTTTTVAPTTTTAAPTTTTAAGTTTTAAGTTTTATGTTTTAAGTTTTAAGTTTTAAGTTTTAAGTTTTAAGTTTTAAGTTTTAAITTTTSAATTTTLPPAPAGTVPMCTVIRRPGGAQRTLLATPLRVQKLLDRGKATLGECVSPANGFVMCSQDRRGNLQNIVVPERYITKRQGKGDALGACAAAMPAGAQ